jgi:hypothetical protein
LSSPDHRWFGRPFQFGLLHTQKIATLIDEVDYPQSPQKFLGDSNTCRFITNCSNACPN